MKLTYRKALPSDIDFLLTLRKETMTAHLAEAGFEINQENHLKGLSYKFEGAEVVLLGGQAIGMIKKAETSQYIEVIQIQILPEFQGQGIGNMMMQSVISEASGRNKAVVLSVLKNNPAKKLYRRLGFEIIEENSHSFIMKRNKHIN